jgi:hypothetical protein
MAEPTAIVADKGIRPGLNETGTTIARRLFVKRVAGSAVDSVALAVDGDSVLGVTMAAIADDDRGDVQTSEMAIVTSGAAIPRGSEVTADGSGKAIVCVNGDYVAGVSRSEASGANEDIEIDLVGINSGRLAVVGP